MVKTKASNKTKSFPSKLTDDSTTLNMVQDMANLFNTFFTTISSKTNNNLDNCSKYIDKRFKVIKENNLLASSNEIFEFKKLI